MAGETIKTNAVCLAIHPWSKTSHVTTWLTPAGRITTVVKGAVRPKSAFLGQYDLNYTCEVLYYARAKGEVHALRECTPIRRRDALREDWRALALAEWFRRLAHDLAPMGGEARAWMELLERGLDALAERGARTPEVGLGQLLRYELDVLGLAGLSPETDRESEGFSLRGERRIPITDEIRACLEKPEDEKNLKILVDTARVIGVYYTFHLDCAPEVRRTALRLISR